MIYRVIAYDGNQNFVEDVEAQIPKDAGQTLIDDGRAEIIIAVVETHPMTQQDFTMKTPIWLEIDGEYVEY